MLPGQNVDWLSLERPRSSAVEHVFCSRLMIQHHTVSLKESTFSSLYLEGNGLSLE